MVLRGVALVLLSFLLPLPGHATPAASTSDPCASAIAHQKSVYTLPHQLLQAISLVESGRYDTARQIVTAWPWTVTAEGNGNYFPTKAAAIAEVRRLQ
ncbi:MAG: soluble lytic murein transglycosylase and related regulatory protein [Rhodospirillaceae bacterium]|nr:MAG: soluble lytic murein transglycosylase and related regulatory protein [Rhodospirillaceae bacterium]